MMISLWLAMAAMLVIAALFFLWPLKRKPSKTLSAEDRQAQSQANIAVFHEHLAELEQARASGRITPEAYDQLKLEQERSLLEDEQELHAQASDAPGVGPGWRFMAVACVVALGVSVGLYSFLGSSEDVRLQQLQLENARLDWEDMRAQRELDPERTRAFMAELEERLERRPDNLQYWFILAQSAQALGDFERAIEAYEQILARDPESPRVMAELAQALFLHNDNRMSPRISSLAHSALQLDPEEPTALGLAGINAFGERNFQMAIDYWQRAVEVLGPRSASSQALQGGIERAKRELAASQPGAESEIQTTTGEDGEKDEPELSIEVLVKLSETAQVEPDQWVFVYARAWRGAPMPLAVTRFKAAELPKTITLSETMAMSTSATLSQAEQVELVARVSQSGTAIAKPGDWQGLKGPVDPRAAEGIIELVIDQQIEQ